MTSYLFVHQNFPGQFLHVAKALAERGDTVVAIGEEKRLRQRTNPHPRIRVFGYPEPAGAGAKTHHYLRDAEAHVRRGQAVFRLAQGLAKKGLRPDVVVAHPGWGEALFLKDVFPHARHVQYLEYFYRGKGGDVGFDPEFTTGIDAECKARVKSSTQLLSFEFADAGISPTEWQKSRYPADWHSRIACIHEGVDTTKVHPDADAVAGIRRADGSVLHLSRNDEVLTYVARNLEPYRGFHSFMRALPAILDTRPQAQVLIVGGNGVSYGRAPPPGTHYRELYEREWEEKGVAVDRSRVHFLGKLSYADYLKVLQVSSLHLYLTYPFVLSWSMLEAMSAGCVVLGSATAPVQEVLRDGENGFLTDFFDTAALADKASDLLARRDALAPIRAAARATIVSRYDLRSQCLPQMLDFLKA
ncbi:MAG: glycosyltransferase family 4 protein [Pseudomonadota bacterium]|nr:glycosyltransferase family 4 protein [Pseudomonadota bacterium]